MIESNENPRISELIIDLWTIILDADDLISKLHNRLTWVFEENVLREYDGEWIYIYTKSLKEKAEALRNKISSVSAII